MRLCDIVDIKSAFMEKTDLSEEEIQTIIDDIPTAFDGDKVIKNIKKQKRTHKPGEGFLLVNEWNAALDKAIEIMSNNCEE